MVIVPVEPLDPLFNFKRFHRNRHIQLGASERCRSSVLQLNGAEKAHTELRRSQNRSDAIVRDQLKAGKRITFCC